MTEHAQEFDVVVVGAGAVGENVADRAGRTGLRVALVEHALVGGECSYWACMPSKALLRPGAVLAAARAVAGAGVSGAVDVAATFATRDDVAHHWDDGSQVDWAQGAGITVLRGHARLTAPRELAIDGSGGPARVTARHAVVIATGSEPVMPSIEGLAEVEPWTSREATSAQLVPARLAVLGGGVVGVEMATAFADLGSDVTLVVRGDRVLAPAEPFASQAVADGLRALGVTVLFGTQTRSARRDDDGVHLSLDGAPDLVVDEVLVATGRRPRTSDLGLETVGLAAGKAVAVDDRLQATDVDGGWLFAVGDVSGRTATTHQGKYDARVVGDVIAARFGAKAGAKDAEHGGLSAADEAAATPWSRYRATADEASVPQVVFTRPEVAWVGLTEQAARDRGLQVRVVGYDIANVAGAYVLAPGYAGRAQMLVDETRAVIVGATFVGPDVAELLHAATIAVVGQVPLDRLWHAVPSYPTVSEVWLRLLESAGL
ncbi:NAD(P)/FAD-dependent oxidoreductase [Cellulomonas sp. URHE0023]|uniref:dihydrolipoyl dehydrogenase family protein n=1 Tax=Cellulomonas sp. URHE0023 TaxID=1380354 RepID=UPI000486CC37|nr:NAD(P)/FAD-dependent oxidoreductase [Cellulomonas sp. URHE0023]